MWPEDLFPHIVIYSMFSGPVRHYFLMQIIRKAALRKFMYSFLKIFINGSTCTFHALLLIIYSLCVCHSYRADCAQEFLIA